DSGWVLRSGKVEKSRSREVESEVPSRVPLLRLKGVQKPYGTWPSPVTATVVAAQGLRLGSVAVDGDDVYWLEGRPAEGGRTVLVRRSPDGHIADVTPPPFYVRTRVHEYGGGAYVVDRGEIYFSNF